MRLFRRPLPAAGATRPEGFYLERAAPPFDLRDITAAGLRVELTQARQLLADVTADRDQLEAANGLLVARVHTLADEVRAMSMPPVGWHYRGGDLVTPWPGERNPT